MAMERDPVCGMDIERSRAAGQSEYEDRTYYFCSPGCKQQFEKTPSRYTPQPASTPQS